jgi:hypothetical protein
MHVMAPFSLLADGWQAWVQPALVLLSVVVASAWLTARWLIRRRSGCTGDCSRCTSAGAQPSGTATPCHKPTGGIRPASLHVLQSSTNLPRSGDV